ncbi:helix-turn-helix transcriptional regulator [Clostridioides sp. ZZV14-6009]|uniref:helix-turn-helix domain-containing protein n=1 Tax=Clostridioides sp. ZZV14-6009 TaxID=2811487 RepID=UPI001D0F6A31|nr:helix-turn-helix transcriptional regulator [Clostridioides sp. ZZV14-6009]
MEDNNIGKNIKKYRLLKGWTQKKLANESGLSKNAIYNYENEKRIPNINNLSKISEALEVDYKTIIKSDYDDLKNKRLSYSEILFKELVLPKLEESISIETNEAKKNCLLGFKYGELREYEKSAKYYEKAIEIDEEYIEAYLRLGELFCITKEYEKAIQYYEKAIEIDEDCVDAYVSRDNTINLLKYHQLINKDIMITSKFSELNLSLHDKINLLNDDCLDLISNLVDKLIQDKNNLK